MTPGKRLLDIICALGLMALMAVPFAAVLVWVLWREGLPLFHVSERMRAPGQPFMLWKLRTMRPAPREADSGVSGGDKATRITPVGRFLRRSRLDEVPQLWNVLKGDMSFVGPRPPLRQYVERFPQLYAQVLRSRPGITGLASVHFHRHEEWLLARCATPAETDAVYARRCVPRKARLDLMYQQRRSLCLDLALMLKTVAKVWPRQRKQR
ncbi:MAG: sugar transferase [Gemmobacter sp.]|jgi:lipopolysaccharide/colanic/teichoic acid biosynthesis glycosyltransferase|nr:sugar transferase [Gemmobacter sp.]